MYPILSKEIISILAVQLGQGQRFDKVLASFQQVEQMNYLFQNTSLISQWTLLNQGMKLSGTKLTYVACQFEDKLVGIGRK